MKLATDLTTVTNIVTIIGVVVTAGAWKMVKSGWNYLKNIKEGLNSIQKIKDELSPNGGGSLKDAVNRVDRTTAEVKALTLARIKTETDGIFKCSKSGAKTFVNRSWCHMTGLIPEEAVSGTLFKEVHPDDRVLVKEQWEAAVENNEDFITTCRIKFPGTDSRVSYVEMNITPLNNNSENKEYYGCITPISKEVYEAATK